MQREFNGFIKSTDYRRTNHTPTTYLPTHRLNDHRPTDKIIFKRLGNRKIFILQNTKTAAKTKNYTSVYLISI